MKIDVTKEVRIDDSHNRFTIIEKREAGGRAPGIGVYDFTEYLITDGVTKLWVPESFLEQYYMPDREPEAYEEGRSSVLRQLKNFLSMNKNPYENG